MRGIGCTSASATIATTSTNLAVSHPCAAVSLSILVINAGEVPGADVPQLYLSFPDDAGEPFKQLKGFRKTNIIEVGSSDAVVFVLSWRDLSSWDVEHSQWKIAQGSFIARIGSSSRNIKLEAVLNFVDEEE